MTKNSEKTQYIKRIIFNSFTISFTICAIITIVNWVQNPRFHFWNFVISKPMFIGFLTGVFLYVGGSFSFFLIRKLIPQDPFYIKRILLFIPLSALITVIVVFCINLLFFALDDDASIVELIKQQRFGYYINFIIISIFIPILIYGLNFYKVFKESQLENQTLVANQATAKFESLKNQIDPHFLFNSLNVLTGLIEEDQQKAIAYTNSLSRIYRYILEQKDKKTVPIAQEIDFAQNYINLLNLRFEDALAYTIDDQSSTNTGHTVPLALQLLLENCIQHNIATDESPLRIEITMDQEYLIVSNNLQEKKNKQTSTEIGLKNIVERYSLLTKKKVEIINNDLHFIVKLPIIKENE